jgi:hypothetical protein
MPQITGSFDVKVTPQAPDDPATPAVGRMTLDKHFHGALEASSKGQMLAFMTETKGSAGYVAMERVIGTLQGLEGAFVLQHNATMNRGTPNLNIVVVPDSGTGALTGIHGTMSIEISGKDHFYTFDYTLPDTRP